MKAVGMIHQPNKINQQDLKENFRVRRKKLNKNLAIGFLLFSVFLFLIGYYLFGIMMLWSSFVSFMNVKYGDYNYNNKYYNSNDTHNIDDTTDICSDPTYDSFYCNDSYDIYSDSSFSSLPGNEYHID